MSLHILKWLVVHVYFFCRNCIVLTEKLAYKFGALFLLIVNTVWITDSLFHISLARHSFIAMGFLNVTNINLTSVFVWYCHGLSIFVLIAGTSLLFVADFYSGWDRRRYGA